MQTCCYDKMFYILHSSQQENHIWIQPGNNLFIILYVICSGKKWKRADKYLMFLISMRLHNYLPRAMSNNSRATAQFNI